MQIWEITETYLRRGDFTMHAESNEALMIAVQKIADDANRNFGTLQFDDFHDEIHVRFTRNNRTRIFMRLQYEGEE